MNVLLPLVLSVEVCPSQRQIVGPRADIVDGEVGQRAFDSGSRRRLLVEHHHGAMAARWHVPGQLQVDPSPTILGDDDLCLDRLHTSSAYRRRAAIKKPRIGEGAVRGEESELSRLRSVGLQDGFNSRTPSRHL